MITITNEQLPGDGQELPDTSYRALDSAAHSQTITPTLSDTDTATQLLLSNRFIAHHPKAGLNPLVDAAACLFSTIGKLKRSKSYQLNTLRDELIQEINLFQDTAKSHGYSSEYILASRYAICATLDDIISHTAWGTEGQWLSHPLLAAFNQESSNQERFFIILERLIKDPHLYIDVMELMYICLSLGFKGHYRGTEYNNNQLEQIINALYKRIRAYRGDFSKMLSPFPIRPTTYQPLEKNGPDWLVILIVLSISLALFISTRYVVNNNFTQFYQELTRMGKPIPYESDNQTIR